MRRWSVVIPVKPPTLGKSRLAVPGVDRATLARAIALDTIFAAAECECVAEVLVVSADSTWDLPARARLVSEQQTSGIAVALALGFAAADRENHRAALLGDLPGLAPSDLAEALRLASTVERAAVADREGEGTTLVTARAGVEPTALFGARSWSRHLAAGLVALDVPADSTLRRDVDRAEHLAAPLGPHTLTALAAVDRFTTVPR